MLYAVPLLYTGLFLMALATAAPPLTPAAWLSCRATAEGRADMLLNRAWLATGADRLAGKVVHYKDVSLLNQNYQSDRTYPPFLAFFGEREAWFDPATGAERAQSSTATPGNDWKSPPLLATEHATWAIRDTTTMAIAAAHGASIDSRPLNALAVLYDWKRSKDVAVAGRCRFRDYSRTALVRVGAHGPETLLLDPKNQLPVGLVREEPHFLWGQVRVEYVWTNWQVADGLVAPGGAARVVNGDAEINRTYVTAQAIASDSAPRLAVPDTALRHEAALPMFLQALPPDTVRVGPSTFLLVNRGYTQAVTLQRDTVFVLDATQSEARARQDSAWIGKLFPGRHPIALVVTDLAWPHIGGVRFWVANGATVISHRASRAFLERVVAQRWTRTPDLLERRRQSARLRYRAVDDSLTLARGGVVLHPIDGISSEGAVVAWVPSERFLWASDYIQNLREPTQYTTEVWLATRRAKIKPERTAAQHIPLTPWATIDGLVGELAREPVAVEAGDTTVHGDLLPLEQLKLRLQMVRGEERTERRGYRQETSRISHAGRPALLKVITVETPRGLVIDSTIADLRTLQPISHISHSAVQAMTLNYEGNRVRGSIVPAGKPPEPIDQVFPTRLFDSGIMDLVVAALPLAEGYSARLPFYIFEHGGLVWRTLRVTGTEVVPAAGMAGQVYLVELKGESQVLRFRIDGRTRRILSTTYEFPGVSMFFAPESGDQ